MHSHDSPNADDFSTNIGEATGACWRGAATFARCDSLKRTGAMRLLLKRSLTIHGSLTLSNVGQLSQKGGVSRGLNKSRAGQGSPLFRNWNFSKKGDVLL